jgi:hypothetical protein
VSTAPLTNEQVAAELQRALAPLQVVPMDADLADEPSLGGLRRYRKTRFEDSVGVLTLLDIDGVLVWEAGAVNATTSTIRRRRGGTASDGTVVTQVKYSKGLGLNQIGERLLHFDRELTPQADAPSGRARLLQIDPTTGVATPDPEPVKNGRILLFVHGTFSNTQRIVDQLLTEPGRSFLGRLGGYDQVLGFDHFTLSRTPMLNALELARMFERSDAELDIICHSRGGLVTRWFAEVLDRKRDRRRRVVFVGCPLRGTSLADPQSLRNGLNLLTNVGKLLGSGAQLVPLFAAAGGLIQILSSVTSFAAKTPLVDAGVGLIPGLAAMSRIKNNAELDALNFGAPQARTDYFAVTSNFVTDEVGWRFLRLFSKSKLADIATDYLVFSQENDLVVDTESMTFHAFGASPDIKNTKTFRCFEGDKVHHTNYFSHAGTLEFVAERFGLA